MSENNIDLRKALREKIKAKREGRLSEYATWYKDEMEKEIEEDKKEEEEEERRRKALRNKRKKDRKKRKKAREREEQERLEDKNEN